jgi:hypothetical protein
MLDQLAVLNMADWKGLNSLCEEINIQELSHSWRWWHRVVTTTGWWRRRSLIICWGWRSLGRRRGRSCTVVVGSLFCAWNTALLLLVVLPVHSCVGFVSSVCGVWILSILLVILGIGLSVVRCASGPGTHGCSSGMSGCGRGSASITTSVTSAIAAVSTAVSTTSISASIAAVAIAVAVAATVSTVAIIVTAATSTSAAARAALLELLVLGANIGQEIETELFGTLNLVGVRASDVQIHGLITLVPGIVLHETRSTALNLDTASSLLLDMFDIGAALAYNLGTEVEARNGLEIHRNLLLWPFATTHGISLDLLWFSATETSLVYKIG